MTDAQFTDLISRGCAKVNISTALKITYMKSNLAFLLDARDRDSWDPPSLFTAVRAAVHGDGGRPHAAVRQRRPGLVTVPVTSALILDCDGVLADTERYGHLVAFNQTFEEFGLPVRWSRRRVQGEAAHRRRQGADGQPAHPRVRRGGRAARRRRRASRPPSPPGTGARPRSTWPWSRTAPSRHGPGSPGSSARPLAAGWRLAVASTSAEASVRATLERAVGADRARGRRGIRRGRGAAQEAGAGHLPARPPRRSGVPAVRCSRHRGLAQRAAGRDRRRAAPA